MKFVSDCVRVFRVVRGSPQSVKLTSPVFYHQVTKAQRKFIVASSLRLDRIRPQAEHYTQQSKLGVFVSWWFNPFASFAWFAFHLIRPAATFSPSDAEKKLFCGTFSRRRPIASANTGLISVTPSAYLNLRNLCQNSFHRQLP